MFVYPLTGCTTASPSSRTALELTGVNLPEAPTFSDLESGPELDAQRYAREIGGSR